MYILPDDKEVEEIKECGTIDKHRPIYIYDYYALTSKEHIPTPEEMLLLEIGFLPYILRQYNK